MEKTSFTPPLPPPNEMIIFGPWEPGGENYFLTEDDKRLLDRREKQFAYTALFGFLAVVIFDVTVLPIPVFTIGILWINFVLLASIIFLARFCGKRTPNLTIDDEEDAPQRRRKMRRTLFLYGLIQSIVALHGEAHFPDYPCVEISVTIALFYGGMLLTLIMTKGRPLEYWAQRTGKK